MIDEEHEGFFFSLRVAVGSPGMPPTNLTQVHVLKYDSQSVKVYTNMHATLALEVRASTCMVQRVSLRKYYVWG